MAFLGGLQGLVHHQDLKDAGVVISIASPFNSSKADGPQREWLWIIINLNQVVTPIADAVPNVV